jgi:hypothetical protein
MLQVVEPTFRTQKELKNLDLTICHYVDQVSVQLNSKETGYVVFHKSYTDYDANAIKEIRTFIELFDGEKETKSVSGTTKLYFELINYNW